MNNSRNILFSLTVRYACAFGFFLLAVRIFSTETFGYVFLLWNLFLAVIPYALSILFERVTILSRVFSWRAGVLFFLWLFFFPNAPYITTDFIHLPWNHVASFRFWYDGFLIFFFAVSGLLLGLGSLFRVQRSLRNVIGIFLADSIVFFVIILSGVGVYLGRFLRWNSWDVIVNPVKIFRDATSFYGDPTWFEHSFSLSLFFSVFTGISYTLFVWLYRIFRKEKYVKLK